jgi:hypothetical protein
MKIIFVFISILVSFGLTSCEKELPSNHALGNIIAVTAGCYGEIVLIEVENPKDIGYQGAFGEIKYMNAIGVPYFSKIGIPDSIPQIIGTEIYFEFRELTSEEYESGGLFSPSKPIICPLYIGPPHARRLIITKVFSFKKV